MIKRLLILVAFVFTAHKVFANVIINEIMYNSEGTDIDWIEIYNPDSSIDLATLNLFIDNSTSNHDIKNYSGSSTLNQGDYGVIVVTSEISTFISKWGNSGNLFTSSFSLPNDQAKVEINDNNKAVPINSVSYNSSMGANEDNNSLQLISSQWLPSLPTPGKENKPVDSGGSNNDTSGTNSDNVSATSNSGGGSSSTSTTTKVDTKIYKVVTSIVSDKVVVAGMPFYLSDKTTGIKKESVTTGRFVWNFGDGARKELVQSEPFTYEYKYPGDYALTLSYYENFFELVPITTDRLNIKVIPSDLSISSVGQAGDSYVEISNKSNYEIPLSNMNLKGVNKSFTIPEGTIILPGKKIRFSKSITGFDYSDVENISLLYPGGELASVYPIYNNRPSTYVKSAVSYTPQISSKKSSNSNIIDLNDLGAEAGKTEQNIPTNFAYWGLGLIIILGIGTVYFIRRPTKKDDDLEETLTAKDMTIIE